MLKADSQALHADARAPIWNGSFRWEIFWPAAYSLPIAFQPTFPIPVAIVFCNSTNMLISGNNIEGHVSENLSGRLGILRSFFDLAPVICVVLDEEGIVQVVNPFGLECLGYREHEVTGKYWFKDFMPDTESGSPLNIFKECMASGATFSFEGNLITRGGVKVIGWSCGVVADEAARPISFILTGRDVTREKVHAESLKESIDRIKEWNRELESIVMERTLALQQSNESLRKQVDECQQMQDRYLNIERMYNAMAHNFPNGIIGVLDEELRYALVDGKELDVFGLKSSDLIGQKVFYWEAEGRSYDAQLQKAFSGEIVSFEIPFLYKAYSVTAVPLPDLKNDIGEILVVIHNISDRKELEASLYRIIAQEKRLNELKSRFITMAMHEFRTPLSTILSSVFLLESYRGELYEENKAIHTSRIKRTVNMLTEILNDFLRLGKLEEGKVEMKVAEINIEEQAADALKAVYPLKKNDQKILYKHSGLHLNVVLDENLLRSILLNLLSNCIKYSHDDGEIILETQLSPQRLEIAVTDHGIGIAVSDAEHIFKRFFRGANAENIEGTGLGLHIVKGYVELMNGTIDFVSNKEKTTFFVKIPLQLAQDETRLILQ